MCEICDGFYNLENLFDDTKYCVWMIQTKGT